MWHHVKKISKHPTQNELIFIIAIFKNAEWSWRGAAVV